MPTSRQFQTDTERELAALVDCAKRIALALELIAESLALMTPAGAERTDNA